MADKYLGSMYNDFFGPGSRTTGKKSTSEGGLNSTTKGTVTNSAAAGAAAGTSKEKALEDAEGALAEARALFDTKKPEEQKKEEKPETDPMEELEGLIGLRNIKHDVKELMDFIRVQKLRQDEGMKSVPVSLHLVFTGNPGTGKTTVARIIARLYAQIGVLSKGQLIEVDRSGLVAGYVGQTALKTQEQINKALGGVLFIDEAYALSQDDRDTFGQEAIDTILKAMEDHRDDLVVIVAGYTEPMEKFIDSNPGLKSRFNKYIEFQDYSVDELEAIFNLNLKKYDYNTDEDAARQIRALIAMRKLTHMENFANARDVRNLFEEIITNQARRVAAIENVSADELRRISLEDLTERDDSGDEAETGMEAQSEKENAGSQDTAAGSGNETVEKTEASEKTETAKDPNAAAAGPDTAKENTGDDTGADR